MNCCQYYNLGSHVQHFEPVNRPNLLIVITCFQPKIISLFILSVQNMEMTGEQRVAIEEARESVFICHSSYMFNIHSFKNS